MNSLQSFNNVANDSWENNPLAPFFKGESMIRQQYHSCPADIRITSCDLIAEMVH